MTCRPAAPSSPSRGEGLRDHVEELLGVLLHVPAAARSLGELREAAAEESEEVEGRETAARAVDARECVPQRAGQLRRERQLLQRSPGNIHAEPVIHFPLRMKRMGEYAQYCT